MDRARIIAAYRIGFALLAIAAIVYQAIALAQVGSFFPTRFFAYFTIQSNLIAIVVFLVGATRVRGERTRGWELVRGAALLYMTVTLLVYNTLLAGTDVDTAVSWVNDVVHKLFPIVLIVDWLIDPPTHRLAFRDTLVWLVYPLAWTGLSLVRGAGRRLVSVSVPRSGQRRVRHGRRCTSSGSSCSGSCCAPSSRPSATPSARAAPRPRRRPPERYSRSRSSSANWSALVAP